MTEGYVGMAAAGGERLKKWMGMAGLLLAGALCLFFVSGLMRSGGSASAAREERLLSNPGADGNALRLMGYLKETEGKGILSGQYCDDGYGKNELAVIERETGKKPAIAGVDLIRYSPSLAELGQQSQAVEWAMEEAADGAIITMCWHWNPPARYLTGDWNNGARIENTTIDLDAIMNGEDEEGYDLLRKDMDAIAAQLARLRDQGIPVIWRPLHEASGGWFWWGNCSPQSYIKLYRLMYGYFTETWELDNLIWLWNGQDADWYPGDDVVDLIGEDIYEDPHVYRSYAPEYEKAVTEYTDAGKPAVLSELGTILSPQGAMEEGAYWGFFCLWSGYTVCNPQNPSEYSEQYTSREALKAVYQSPEVITRDELPAW